MNIQDSLKILRDIKSVYFATVDENCSPQVRVADVMIVEDEKLYFCTAIGKAFYKQLLNSKKVAIAGMNDKYEMIKLSGEANLLEEQKYWIDRIIQDNPAIDELYAGDKRNLLKAFVVENFEIEYFSLGVDGYDKKRFYSGNRK